MHSRATHLDNTTLVLLLRHDLGDEESREQDHQHDAADRRAAREAERPAPRAHPAPQRVAQRGAQPRGDAEEGERVDDGVEPEYVWV